jgi:hypothetical protein
MLNIDTSLKLLDMTLWIYAQIKKSKNFLFSPYKLHV